jgi:type IV fimbrial biogenesis protein FimT
MRAFRLPAASAAFTVIELVVALSVAATLFAIAVPSYARYIAEQRLLNEARRLSEAIMLARSEAVKRNAHVVICAKTAVAPCGEAGHWHGGWVIFEDQDGNAEPDPGDPSVLTEPPATEGVTMRGNRPVADYLRFDYIGQPRMASGALQMGTIEVCKPGLRGWRVVLANTGRTRLDRMPGACP